MKLRKQLTQPEDPSYRLIPLTRGQFAMVDPEDYEELSKFNWHAVWSRGSNTFYAVRTVIFPDGKRRSILMHRQIMDSFLSQVAGLEIDHRNHDGLDNRRCNIRVATRSQNSWNRQPGSIGKSGYRGVSYSKSTNKKWRAVISKNGRHYQLGLFDTPEEASAAYQSAVMRIHGEFSPQE